MSEKNARVFKRSYFGEKQVKLSALSVCYEEDTLNRLLKLSLSKLTPLEYTLLLSETASFGLL